MKRRFKALFTSLWFKVVGAFIFVLLLLSFSLLNLIDKVTTDAFGQYLVGRTAYIEDIVPTLLPRRHRMPLAPSIPAIPEIPPVPTIPPIPANPPVSDALPFTIVGPDGEVIVSEVIEPVIVDVVPPEIVMEELVRALTPTDMETFSLVFLQEVRQGVQRTVFFAMILAVIVGTVLVRQITRPLTRLRQAAQTLAQGDLSVRVPIKSRDEIGRVAESFNQMAADLEQQEQVRRQMVADVAHELRTPLTVMNSNLEAMLDGLLDPTPAELGELHEETRRLIRMIEDLRLLSLADAGRLQINREEINVYDLIERVISRLTPLAQAQGVKLPLPEFVVPLPVSGDADKLQQALGNLVDNGLRHTPAGGKVLVTAVQDAHLVRISVTDTGPGIPPEDLPHLFDRFWRGDKSRSRHSGGSGLGLSIVQQIAEHHGGSVTAVSPDGMGAVFTLTLPLASPPKRKKKS
ncbi:MAG: ATP-binding protein [Chloroflexota bacterium]